MATYEQIVEANRATFAAFPDFRLRQLDLVVEDVHFWDVAGLLSQLGAAS